MECVATTYSRNENYVASAIKLQTLAARYFVHHADSFDEAEHQLSQVADLIRKCVYMDQKEQVRVAAAKSLSSLMPMLRTRPLASNVFFQSALNYESYLKLMSSMVFVMTDEHPELRQYMTH